MSRLRIRTLKPDCWVDEAISGLPRDVRLLFAVLITFADDDGRFRDSPTQIMGHGYIDDEDVSPRAVSDWMDQLVATGVLARYEVDGKKYATFPKWHRHQRINRHTQSLLPKCPRSTGVAIVPRKITTRSAHPHDSFTEEDVNDHDKRDTSSRHNHDTISTRSPPDRECGVGSVERERESDTTLREAVEVVGRASGRASNHRLPVA